MKLRKWFKTIMLAGSILTVGAIASTIVVSCSNTRIPPVTNAISNITIGSSVFTRDSKSGALRCEQGYTPNDGTESFKVSPGYDTKNPTSDKNKATNEFTVIDTALGFIQSFGTNILTIIQNLYNSKIYSDVLGLSFDSVKPIAEFSFEGEGAGVIRSGLKSIETSAPTGFDVMANPTKDTPVKISFSGIKYSYSKWYSPNGDNVSWKDSLGDISFTPSIELSVKPVFSGDNWTGQCTIDADSIMVNGEKIADFSDTMANLKKAIDGDILNTTLKSYCEKNKDKVISFLSNFGIS